MLSAQRKEFEEKKKDESPYPRDFARWYALDYFRRPRKLKSARFYVTLATAAVFTLLSAASLVPVLHRVHQAAPVSKAHELFNQNCAICHDQMFAPVLRLVTSGETVSVSDNTCNTCHDGAPHHAKQAREAACVSCHREHQGHEVLRYHVPDHNCTGCHGDLPSHMKPGDKTTFHAVITDFNRDHPEFQPSLKENKDHAKIKFNHQAHLDLDLAGLRRALERAGRTDLENLGPNLECATCHQLDEGRRYFLPIQYEKDCAGCHQLNVSLVGNFPKELGQAVAEFSKTPLPHKEPLVVRAVLRERLVQFAQKNAVVLGKVEPSATARLLPWKTAPSISDEQWSWATGQGRRAEELLFMNKQWSKAEQLTWCSHCHIEKNNDRPDGLPTYLPTAIPARWYKHAVFNHGSHRLLSCVECHDRNPATVKVAQSKSTEDILLPTLATCQECHRPGVGARNECALCHRYHDRSRERSPDGFLKLTDVLGGRR